MTKIQDDLRKKIKSLRNRLCSIASDAQFVESITNLIPSLPVFPNERCGNWYVNPEKASHGSVYFKSTDGHYGKWNFNLRRNNFHVLTKIIKHGGCFIVDSTRNGKRIPDALSKTIPLWCAVINNTYLLLKSNDKVQIHSKKNTVAAKAQIQDKSQIQQLLDTGSQEINWDSKLYIMPSIISRNEHNQMENTINPFSLKLIHSTQDSQLTSHILALKKPLRPIWITPDSRFFQNGCPWENIEDLDFYPIICISASASVSDGLDRRHGYVYVQGSADDEEMWSKGLNYLGFWKYKENFIQSINDEECEELAMKIIQEQPTLMLKKSKMKKDAYNWIGETGIAIGNRSSGSPSTCFDHFDFVVNCGAEEYPEMKSSNQELSDMSEMDKKNDNTTYLFLPIAEGKKGQLQLLNCLKSTLDWLTPHIVNKKKILFHCAQGIDRSVGVAMACALEFFVLKNGEFILKSDKQDKEEYSKVMIMDTLIKIQQYRVEANPTRATLKRLNEFFMTDTETFRRKQNTK